MSELLCIRCHIGIPREHRASTMFRTAQMTRHAIVVLWCRTTRSACCGTRSHSPELIPPLIILVLGLVAHDVIFIVIVITSILIGRVSWPFLCPFSCRSFEALSANTTMQSTLSQTPISLIPSDLNVEREKFDQNTSRSNIEDTNRSRNSNSNGNRNPTVSCDVNVNASLNEKRENIENVNCKSVKCILSSPDNPATVRRLSQRDSCNVSWHKRVVVHRVPRSDASRSMFVTDNQSQEGLSSQCCVIV